MSGFYQRVAPAVMTDYLMADFKIGAAALGNFSAFYFYSYVAVQVPTGILADYWGPRKLLTVGAFIAALGAFLFAAAPTILFANIGRLLIGGSVGVAWVVLLMLSIHWFPPHRFAMTSGLGLFFGMAGAVSAGVPLRILVDQFGWRPVMLASAGVSLIIALALWIIVRDDPSERGYTSFAPPSNTITPSPSSLLPGLLKVFCYKNTWLLSIAPAGIVGPMLAFSGLWGVPFLTTHYGLTPAKSAALTSMLLVACAVGGPLLGAFSDRIGSRKPIYMTCCFAGCAGWSLILFVPDLPLWVLAFLILVVGFASGVMVLSFAFVKESVPPSLAGTVSGVCNMGIMIGPMVLQPAMGYVLDSRWNGLLENGTRIYHLDAYQSAFTLLIYWSVISAILTCFTTETNCRQIVE
ncbi:MAG: MFS transporter [Desulfobacteraceae bacterium]|nr:MFS transporter [Desulfobacteraceae bacterium]